MPSSYTTNYKLNQWVRSDRVLMEDFNADNAKIDAALAGKASTSELNTVQTALAGKASSAELNTVRNALAGKAEASALTTKADASALTALTKQVTTLDGAALRAKYGSYTGTGTHGANNAKVLTFDRLPVLLIVQEEAGYDILPLVRGMTETTVSPGYYTSSLTATVSWDSSKKQVSWYSSSARGTMNVSGTTYRYTAIF